MTTAYDLLQALSDGRFRSGQVLGEMLGISRAAVWKHVNAWREKGLDIDSVPGRGYRLAEPLELLDEALLRRLLVDEFGRKPDVLEVHWRLDSTNTHLRCHPLAGAGKALACLAEEQTAGRGRRGRRWVSPPARNLCLSLAWTFEEGMQGLDVLSLAAGVALMRALRDSGVREAGLKWPNDVLARDRKLAGILVELSGEAGGPCRAVIGIGVNIRLEGGEAGRIDQPWIDLARLCPEPPSRNRLAARILGQLMAVLDALEKGERGAFMDEWRRYDVVSGRQVRVHLRHETLTGEALGIDEDGAFLVQTGRGCRRLVSGEVSLRMTT